MKSKIDCVAAECLLRIKDSDIREMVLEQGRDAVDRGLHVGGAFSAVIPLVALYFGGTINLDVVNPTRAGQDMFILSKGHAVATLAAIMADKGYFDRALLTNSRSFGSILNGHPGPILPGVPISTGPEGHGMPVAQGYALAGSLEQRFDVYCLVGDGELQSGLIWEAVMYSGQTGLENLCILIDHNGGQLDNPRALAFPMKNIASWFTSFGWNAVTVDARDYRGVCEALDQFKRAPRRGRPTAIVCESVKGWGGFSDWCAAHKTTISPDLVEIELERQRERRASRVEAFLNRLKMMPPTEVAAAVEYARFMGLAVDAKKRTLDRIDTNVITCPAEPRNKEVSFDIERLPLLEPGKEYSADWVIRSCMQEYGRSGKVVTVDSDLSSTSGLKPGLAAVDSFKAFNVGVAESNMISIGEAWAALGYNVWVSTFCPFFDWRVMRRIAIGYQERLEAIESGLWLSEGHNLDMVFLATASNLETRTNGATHMGNDDALLFSEIAHLTIVDISCPNLLRAFIRWIMEGNRGLVYARVLRAPAAVLYPGEIEFSSGRSFRPVPESEEESVVIVTSGRGVYEALDARRRLHATGVTTGVVDMPFFDRDGIDTLLDRPVFLVLAEQNNGLLLKSIREQVSLEGRNARVLVRNLRGHHGERRFIHSATYDELTNAYGLSGERLAATIHDELEATGKGGRL